MSGRGPGLKAAGLRQAGDPGGAGGGGGGGGEAGALIAANNLGDLPNSSLARFYLGLGTGAVVDVGTMAVQDAGAVAITGGTITGLGAPTSPTDAVTKAYADALAAGLSWKAPVRVATQFSGGLSSAFVPGSNIDNIFLVAGDRILIMSQATASENGIYVVNASGAPTRAADADAGAELLNAAVFVEEGFVNHDRAFICTADAPIVVNTTALTWVGFASALGAATTVYVDAQDNANFATIAANYLSKVGNLAGLASTVTARTNLGLAAIASSGASADITDATTPGRALLTAASAAAQRTALGLLAIATSAVAANITDASAVGRSMLTAASQAAQTALIALATQALAGLMSAADKLKLDGQELIEDVPLTASTSHTSPTWAVGKYASLEISFDGAMTGGYIQFQVNGDTGLHYIDFAKDVNAGGVAGDSSALGSLGYARLAVSGVGSFGVTLRAKFSLKKTGLSRAGTFQAMSDSNERSGGFLWNDTTSDITNITLSGTAGGYNQTGRLIIKGNL